MPVKASGVLHNVAVALQDDQGYVRWPLAELLRYLNDGMRELLDKRPEAFAQLRFQDLASGAMQKAEGGDAYSVLAVKMNVDSASGQVPMETVRPVTLAHLDNFSRTWRTDTEHRRVDNYALDEYSPTRFWVHPPNDGTGAVALEVAVNPGSVQIAEGADAEELDSYNIDLPVRDVFAPALTYYVLHRAWAKDADFAGNQQNSNQYYEWFLAAVGSGA